MGSSIVAIAMLVFPSGSLAVFILFLRVALFFGRSTSFEGRKDALANPFPKTANQVSFVDRVTGQQKPYNVRGQKKRKGKASLRQFVFAVLEQPIDSQRFTIEAPD